MSTNYRNENKEDNNFRRNNLWSLKAFKQLNVVGLKWQIQATQQNTTTLHLSESQCEDH